MNELIFPRIRGGDTARLTPFARGKYGASIEQTADSIAVLGKEKRRAERFADDTASILKARGKLDECIDARSMAD